MKLLISFAFLLFLSGANAQTVQWAGKLGGPGATYASAVVVDAAGNTFVTGWFDQTCDMDPGPGTANLTVGVGGDFDIHVTKLDANGAFVWTRQLGGNGYDYGRAIAVDAAGNVYVAGDFQGTADFDPGPNTFPLTSAADGSDDLFVCKLSASGDFMWARRMGGFGDLRGFGIAVNAAQEVYITGNFIGTVDFDPGAGVANLTATGPDIFVSKLDAAGNYLWAVRMGGPLDDAAQAITLAANGDLLLTGYFRGTADFDPGAGVVDLVAAGTINESDAFVCRLDPAGTFVWARSMSGPSREIGYGIAVDDAGAVLTTGSFIGTVDFDPGPGETLLTEPSGLDRYTYVSKLDGAGNFVWAKQLGGQSFAEALAIAVDAAGSVYTTGWFAETADFDPGPAVFNLTSSTAPELTQAFISKLDSQGQFAWAVVIGGAAQTGGAAIAVELNGTVRATGFFFGTADLDPGPGVLNVSAPPGVADSYVLRLADLNTGVAVQHTAEDAITVFPNPTSGAVTVTSALPMDELLLQDAQGRVLQRSRPGSTRYALYLDDAGVYFLRIRSGNRVMERSVVGYGGH